MASRNGVLRGQSVELIAIFLDAGGDYADPTDLSLSLYPPGSNPELGDYDDDAWVLNATTTSGGTGPHAGISTFVVRESEGRYVYTFTVPEDVDVGGAFDRWQGTIDSEELDETFSFVILGGGSVGVMQLLENNMVFITISKDVAAADESTMTEDWEYYFTTHYNPLYASVRRIRLDLGPLLADVPDDTINLAIFEASLETDAFTFVPIVSSTLLSVSATRYFEFARKQYTVCAAELILLGALSGASSSTSGMSKSLADLRVAYSGPGGVSDLMERAMECKVKWEATLTSNGEIGPGTSQKPSMVIKGSQDPDRPNIGRGWESSSTYSNPYRDYPAANTKVKWYGHRRAKRTYRSRFGV